MGKELENHMLDNTADNQAGKQCNGNNELQSCNDIGEQKFQQYQLEHCSTNT